MDSGVSFTPWAGVRKDRPGLRKTKITSASSLLLQPAIAAYFDQTMVMVEDEAVKQNRLATLQIVSNEAEKVANFMALDVKSN